MLALVSMSSDSAIGRLVRLKNDQILLGAVFEDREVVFGEIGDVVVLIVDDGDVERDDVDGRAKQRRLFLFRLFLSRTRLRGEDDRCDGANGGENDRVQRTPHHFGPWPRAGAP